MEETHRAWLSLGRVQYGVQEAEKKSVQYKRSIYVVKDIAQGEQFSEQHIRVIRPGNGLPPKFYEAVLEKQARSNIKAGTPLTWEML